MSWLISSLIAMLCWGIWGLVMKVASEYLGWQQVFVISNIVTLVATLLIFIFLRPVINVHSSGFCYALMAGIVGSVAFVAFNYAINIGRAIIVVPLTAFYPIVTIILSYFVLHEEISLPKAAGIALGLAAILLITIE